MHGCGGLGTNLGTEREDATHEEVITSLQGRGNRRGEHAFVVC